MQEAMTSVGYDDDGDSENVVVDDDDGVKDA